MTECPRADALARVERVSNTLLGNVHPCLTSYNRPILDRTFGSVATGGPYLARERDCRACPLKPQCTTGKARSLSISIHEPARQEAKALAETEALRVSKQRRQKVEMLFAHLKQQLGIRRLRLRGLQGAAEEFNLAATVQNLQRLANLTAQTTMGRADIVATG